LFARELGLEFFGRARSTEPQAGLSKRRAREMQATLQEWSLGGRRASS
jgi:hypothetical protein